jgi:hypothetical protein
MARTKATKQQVGCTVATVLLVLLGLVLFAGSWLARYELQQTTENAILDTIIIDSKVFLGRLPPPPSATRPHLATTTAGVVGLQGVE